MIGYRVGEPEETNAKKLIEFEVVELGNEHLLKDLSVALRCEAEWEAVKRALDSQFGENAVAMWLCDSPEWAEKRYGPGEVYSVEIPSGAIIGSDLGADGKLWIWRKQTNPGTVFVEIRMLKDAPPITGSDMKTYGPFRKGRVYAIPKGNARVFIKQGIAVATRKEAEKPTLKEMFKGEVLTPYIEAALVKPLVETEEKKTYAVPGKPWMGEFTATSDEEAVISQIVENCKYWDSNICKRATLEKYCTEKGIKDPGAILDDLERRGIAYTPKKGYIGLTEPEKYDLPPIERPKPEMKLKPEETGSIADYFLTQLSDRGIAVPGRFKGEFEKALDPHKTWAENIEIMDGVIEEIVIREHPAEENETERRRKAQERAEALIKKIREARGE